MTEVALIGVGRWGRNHLRTLALMPGVRLRAVCELDAARHEEIGRGLADTRVTASLDEAIDRSEAVVIAASASTHYAIAKAALEAGRHVFVEKPLALRVDEGRELLRLAAEAGRTLMVGHLMLYHPAFVALERLVKTGGLGRPLYAYAQRTNLGQIRRDENVVWSLAPHDVSMALALFGAPERIRASAHAYVQPGIEDVGFLSLEFDGGVVSHTHVSWLDPHKVRKLTVVGDEKMVVLDDTLGDEKLKIYDKGAEPTGEGLYLNMTVRYGDIHSPRIEMHEPLRLELEHFVRCVRSGETPRTDGAEGLEVLRVLEAADRSCRAGGQPVAMEQE